MPYLCVEEIVERKVMGTVGATGDLLQVRPGLAAAGEEGGCHFVERYVVHSCKCARQHNQ